MNRPVDKKRTAEARARHAAGVAQLDKLFAVPVWYRRWRGLRMVSGLQGLVLASPPRVRPQCPPLRDPATKARHLKRKRAAASRRRNRCR